VQLEVAAGAPGGGSFSQRRAPFSAFFLQKLVHSNNQINYRSLTFAAENEKAALKRK